MKSLWLSLILILAAPFAAATTSVSFAPATLTPSCAAVTGTGACTPLFLPGNSLAIGVSWQISYDTGTASAISVTLQGSNDNSTWTTQDTNTTCVTTGGSGCSRSYQITGAYKYLRCNVGTYTLGTTDNLTCSITVNPNAISAGGTVTQVSGTANQIDVATGTTTPVVSLDSAIHLPGSATVESGGTLTIASGATLTCAAGSTCPSSGGGTFPAISGYTCLFISGATATVTSGYLSFFEPGNSSNNNASTCYKAAPATPWTQTMDAAIVGTIQNYIFAGESMSDSTGALILFGIFNLAGTTTTALGVEYWTSPTAYSSQPIAYIAPNTAHVLLRMQDDGTNLHFLYSIEGAAYLELPGSPLSRTAFLSAGPTRAGFGVQEGNGNTPIYMESGSIVGP